MQSPRTESKTDLDQLSLAWMQPGKLVWVPANENAQNSDSFYQGEIISIESKKVKVRYNRTQVKDFDAEVIFQCNDYTSHLNGFDDMVDMENLNDAELLNNVKLRFMANKIFTYIGPTLMVVNPFKQIDDLFTPEIFKEFLQCVRDSRIEFREHIPHVWAVAADTIIEIIKTIKEDEPKNQAIIISGESGAGKTENTKYCMKFLTTISHKTSTDEIKTTESDIEDRILACSPVLEAFGNATTALNDNSSRFGKYVSLLVDRGSYEITGATIQNYLLEKSRVITQADDERNYHIFYHVLKGASQEDLEALLLKVNGKVDMSIFQYLKSKRYNIDKVNDVELYKGVVKSFNTMNFSKEEQQTIWQIISAVLWLGNVDFDESTRTDSHPCKLIDEDPLKRVSKLLSVEFDTLLRCLTVKTKVVLKEVVNSPLHRNECINARDSLAKELYNRLFSWLVKKLNSTILSEEDVKSGARIDFINKYRTHIGLLDIFGFEIFKTNSLEQFCINFANEKLHYLYIDFIFNNEEKEFIKEDLQQYFIKTAPNDNIAVIELMSVTEKQNISIFRILDELCMITADDDKFLQRCKYVHKNNKKFETPITLSKNQFLIHHTPKDVTYTATGFRAKNLDDLLSTAEDAILKSSSSKVVEMFRITTGDEKDDAIAKKKASKYLGKKFLEDMDELYNELKSCTCHFIRCMKPNNDKKKGVFIESEVLNQLRYMGVSDSIKVKRDGYPIRKTFSDFYERYINLTMDFYKNVDEIRRQNPNYKELAMKLVERTIPELVENNHIVFGKTKVFIRIDAYLNLEKMMNDIQQKRMDSVKKVLKSWRRKKQKNTILKYIRVMEKYITKWRLRRKMMVFYFVNRFINITRIAAFKSKHGRCVLIVQSRVRRYIMMKRFRKLRLNIIKMQSFARMVLAKKELRALKLEVKKQKCATKIQSFARVIFAKRILRELQRQAGVKKFALEIVFDLVMRAFIEIDRVRFDKAARVIKRYWDGYIARKRHAEEVRRIKDAYYRVAGRTRAPIIQRCVRGWIVRSAIDRLNRAASYIQATVKMCWLTFLLKKLRRMTLVIQRCVRRWMYRRRVVNLRLKSYIEHEYYDVHRRRISEQFTLLGNLYKEEPRKFDFAHMRHTTHQVEFQDVPLIKNEPRISTLNNTFARVIKKQSVTPYDEKKIKTFIKLIDIDILLDTSEIYDEFWSLTALRLQKDMTNINADMMTTAIGESHTVAASDLNKLYSWGCNDVFQLGRKTSMLQSDEPNEVIIENLKPRTLVVGDNHNMVLDYFGNLHVWGSNEKGQYGMGHQEPVNEIAIIKFLPEKENIMQISGRGNNNLVVTDFGRAFYWPMKMRTGEIRRNPVELNFPSDKFRVISASCGYNFAALITSGGFLFTFGEDNSVGQLGVGDTEPRDKPTLVETFLQTRERVNSIVCGFKHSICKTVTGKVYTWGWGGKGQLGHESKEDEWEPRRVRFDEPQEKVKPLQINCGYRHSLVLFEDRKIFWWGTNGELKEYHTPTLLEYSKKSPDLADFSEYAPFKINCTWSKSISLTYLSIADMRTVNELNRAAKHKVINQLASKIDEDQAYNDIHPPLVPTISKYFNNKTFRHYPLPKRQFKKVEEIIPSKIVTKKIVEQEKVFLLEECSGFKYTLGQDPDLVHLHESSISTSTYNPQTPKRISLPNTAPLKSTPSPYSTLNSQMNRYPEVPTLLFSDREMPPEFISSSSSGRANSYESTLDSQFSSFFSPRRRTLLPKIEEENPSQSDMYNVKLYERSPSPV